MIKTILVTGGTGFVGKGLVDLLLQRGYTINLLVRRDTKTQEHTNLRIFKWNVYKGEIDDACIRDVDAIIHLAGEDIASNRWTTERKQQIVESRTKSIRMIYTLLRENKNRVNHVISASAVGYYGDRDDELLTEDSLPSKDFLAETSIAWEEAVDEGKKLGLRIVKLRSGIILGESGGVLEQMDKPSSFGIAIIPGTGKQWVSWIHLHDALNIYIYTLENETMQGVYNMVAPEPVTLEDLTRYMAKATKRSPLFLYAPEWALKLAIGEMSIMVLESIKASSDKLKKAGYLFKFSTIQAALNQVYNSKKL